MCFATERDPEKSQTLFTRTSLRVSWTLLALLALVAWTTGGALAQDATPDASPAVTDGGPALGDAVILFDNRGNEQAEVTVTSLVDPFDEVTSNAERGHRFIAAEVTVQNLSDDPYPVNIYDMRLVDGEGILYSPTSVSRTEESLTATADLAAVELEAGAATSGYLFYDVVDAAIPAAVAYTNSSETFTLLADRGDIASPEGEATTLYDARGEEIGTISLDESRTALEDTSDVFAIARGETVLGAVLTIENTGDAPLTPDFYAMQVVDEFGYLYDASSFSRDAEDIAELPDFPFVELAPGDSATGLVTFTLPVDAEVTYVLYIPGGSQLFIVARSGDGAGPSGDRPSGSAGVETDGTDHTDTGDTSDVDTTDEETLDAIVECGDIVLWSEETRANIAALDRIDVLHFELDADVRPDDLRDAADEIRDVADAQGEIDAPDLAGETHDAVVTFLEAFADALDDAADDIDGGAASEDVVDDLFAAVSDHGQALAILEELQSDLQSACPGFDIGF